MENRNGLVVQACVTPAGRKAEREAAEAMVTPVAGKQNNKRQSGETLAALTLAADKSYQAEEFIKRLRELQVVPHIAEYEKETPLSKNWLSQTGPGHAPHRSPASQQAPCPPAPLLPLSTEFIQDVVMGLSRSGRPVFNWEAR